LPEGAGRFVSVPRVSIVRPDGEYLPVPAGAQRPAGLAHRDLSQASAVERLGRHDLDAEAAEADIGALRGGEQADRGDVEVAQDLRAEADLAPLPRARGFRAGVAVRDLGD